MKARAVRTLKVGGRFRFPVCPMSVSCPTPRDVSEEEVIAETKHGIFIEGNGSYSIDQQRYNFQFGGQSFWEIKDGKRIRMLRNVAYQARTQDFWNSMALIGGQQTYALGGTFNDGKGQPSAVEFSLPRLPGGPFSKHQRAEDSLMTQQGSNSPTPKRHGLSAAEARQLCERVLKFSKAENARVNITSGIQGFTRTAANRVTTAGVTG